MGQECPDDWPVAEVETGRERAGLVVNTLAAIFRRGAVDPLQGVAGSAIMGALLGFSKVSDHRNLGA